MIGWGTARAAEFAPASVRNALSAALSHSSTVERGLWVLEEFIAPEITLGED